jgi:hypothetical protein
MSNNKADIRFIGFNKYVKEPIKENTYKNWVTNGHNNSNYKYIIDMYNGSVTNKAINNAYSDLAYGRGLAVHDDNEKETLLREVLDYFPKKQHKPILIDNQILGEHALQVHRQKGAKNKLASIEHISKSNVVPSIANEDGVIESYWYSSDWSKSGWQKYKPVEYPALGFADKFNFERPEIFVGKPYQIGQEYFAQPDYDSCLQYASIEQEISNYYESHIKNGLSFGTIINVPNSKNWSDEDKDIYIKNVNGKLSGSSNAGGKVFAFLSGEEPTTISNVENNTAHKQWDFLTKEASSKIISAHKCVSPMLVGLGTASGFSSNADEMDTMETQLMKRIIAPKQDFVLDSIKEVLQYFNLDFDIYFRPLTEIEGEDEEKEKIDKKEVSEDIEMSKKKSELDIFLDKGEIEDLVNFDIVDENEVDYNEEIKLVSTGVARPNSKSSQDTEDIVIRYRYVGNPNPERGFCKAMMSANKVYRKEDIEQLTNKVVNAGWGPNGADTYSIWLYKGGGSCHHKWNRVIYLRKGKTVDVNSPLAETISTSKARSKGYKVEVNDSKVAIEPRNMKNKGFLKPR